MFKRLLIANRGEIACRVMRTARRLDIATIAVFSDADAKSKHVREADEAIWIGPAPARDSYLAAEKILAAARETGAEAIHPGYGFLSENPAFAEAVAAAGLIWIGPHPGAIRAMGLKDESKRIAKAAGAPVLEGYQGPDQSVTVLRDAADSIGYPVLIKAVAGGGGRGIREVRAAADFAAQLASAQREAAAAFGDDRVLVEKLVDRPRHIEIQVFGDKHGGLVHLFERDCSLQRRRQKVIEEAPAPGMTLETRAAMTEAALRIARAVAYDNAGTVELIVDGTGPLRPDGFWFLEMNTRLQVEHPATEAITGLDLVEWQFRAAAGEKLPLDQGAITCTGAAIEARLCAEDPAHDFRPSAGRFRACRFDGEGRWDAGYEAGDAMSGAYDNLVAKLICHAPSRAAAIAAVRDGLADAVVLGPQTNTGYLRRLLADEDFAAGRVDTGLIARRHAEIASVDHLSRLAAAMAAALDQVLEHRPAGDDPWAALDGWRVAGPQGALCRVEDGAGEIAIRLTQAKGRWRAEAGDQVAALAPLGDRVAVLFGEQDVRVVHRDGGGYCVDGDGFAFAEPGAHFDLEDLDAGDVVKAPMPGKVIAVRAKAGDQVKKGAALVVVEAMKVEQTFTAPRDGVLAEVAAIAGAQVRDGEVLARLEPVES